MSESKPLEVFESDRLLHSTDLNLDSSAPGTRRYKGWRFSLLCSAALASTVLILNLALLIWAFVRFGLHGGVVTLYTGSCPRMQSIFTWTHLAINILSTLLLSASNFCMQCLAAPTREEVDKEHTRENWLDIGVMSLRNLRSVARWRFYMWLGLAASSIPLHLL
jgi:hypothetical protein